MEKNNNSPEGTRQVSMCSFALLLGLTMIAPIVILGLFGYAIDKIFTRAQEGGFFFLLVGTGVGMIIASILGVKKVKGTLDAIAPKVNMTDEDFEEKEVK